MYINPKYIHVSKELVVHPVIKEGAATEFTFSVSPNKGVTYKAPVKPMSHTKWLRISAGTYRRNDWGAEWYVRQADNRRNTQAMQDFASCNKTMPEGL